MRLNNMIDKDLNTASTFSHGSVESKTFSRPKSLAENAAWSLALPIWQTIIGFFYTPFLIHYIGSDFYGLFILLMSIVGLLGIMNMGLGDATLRYVAYYHGRHDLESINRVVGSTLLIYITIGLITGYFFFLFSPLLVKFIAIPQKFYDLGTKLLQLTSINFTLRLVGGAIDVIPQAIQRFDISTKVSIFESIFQITGIVVILLGGFGIYEIVFWSVITTVIIRIISYIVAKKLIKGIKLIPSFSRSGLKEVFGYGIFSFMTQILGTIWAQLDRLLLGTIVSASSVAYLTVPHNLAFRGSFAIGRAGSVLFSRFSATENQKEIKMLYLDSTWLLLCSTIIIFVPLTVLFPDFLRLWINPEFALQSSWVAQIIACSCIVRGAFIPYDNLFKGIGKPQYVTLQLFCSAITGMLANIILIPTFGLAGAGYSYCLTLFWGFAAIIITWKKILKVNSIKPLIRAVLLPIIVSLLLLCIFYAIRYQIDQPGWLGLISLGFTFFIFSSLSVIGLEKLFGREKSHANIIIRHTSKLIKKIHEQTLFYIKRSFSLEKEK